MMKEKKSQKEHSSAKQNQRGNNQEVVVINCKKIGKCLHWKNATATTFYLLVVWFLVCFQLFFGFLVFFVTEDYTHFFVIH